jgi:hypothetical protein
MILTCGNVATGVKELSRLLLLAGKGFGVFSMAEVAGDGAVILARPMWLLESC